MQPCVNTEEFITVAPQVVHSRAGERAAETGSFPARSTGAAPRVNPPCGGVEDLAPRGPRSLVRSAPAGMPDDLRQLAVTARAARAARLAGAPLLIEHHHLVIQRDVPLRPAEHLDGRGPLAARFPGERFHPAEDLHRFVGDPALALPPLAHASPSLHPYDLHSPGRTPSGLDRQRG